MPHPDPKLPPAAAGAPQDRAAEDPLSLDFAPWEFTHATEEQRSDQAERADELRSRGYQIGRGCFVSRLAVIQAERLELGDRSYFAASVHVSGDVELGADCSVNIAATVRGKVRIGRAVRIGAQAAILGFDHSFADTTTDIFQQPLSSIGVFIGDDVWIGTHVVVVDGVSIGSHAVIGAGSVVTRDVPDWAVAVGNPARVIRDRRSLKAGPAGTGPESRLEMLAGRARDDIPGVLSRAFRDGRYYDRAGVPPTVRAHTDAIELAALLLGGHPPQLQAQDHQERLRHLQDPRDGLVAELGNFRSGKPKPAEESPSGFPDQQRAYHVLCVGYALRLLGTEFAHPVRAYTEVAADALIGRIENLPWQTNAWGAGAQIDSLGTALTWEALAGRPTESLREVTIGWLTSRRNHDTGLWGTRGNTFREPLNGTYRLLRGTFAQWGVPLGGEAGLVDTVLRHTPELSSPWATACDALDVTYLLWFSSRTRPDYRRADVTSVAHAVLDHVRDAWLPGQGFAFERGAPATLQGTQMWLSAAWYAADLLGISGALGYRPGGVHRPEAILPNRLTGEPG